MTTQHDERAELIRNLESYAAAGGSDLARSLCEQAAALLAADAQAGGEVVDWRDGVNVARLRAALTRIGVATGPSEEGMAADLENWVNTLTRAVTAGKQAAQVAQPLTDQQREQIAAKWRGRNWTLGDIIDAVEAAHCIGKDQASIQEQHDRIMGKL